MLKRHGSLVLVGSILLATIVAACSSDDTTTSHNDGEAGEAGVTGESAGAPGSAGANANEGGSAGENGNLAGSSGPSDSKTDMFAPPTGTAKNGQDVFRFETFGNEGYWTRTMRLPQGMLAKKVTPVQALQAGLSVDIDSVPAAVRYKVIAEAKTDLSAANAPILNDPASLAVLIEANAILGVSARNVKTFNGTLDINDTDIFAGESVGVTCALCHSITDGSVFSLPNGGSIGKRVDGPTNHNLNVGAAIALADNSRAFYPTLALDLVNNKHMSVSRKGAGVGLISKTATEVEVDAYLNDPTLYPVGMFDDAIDGDGAPMHITPMFRADLAAPWGSEGSIEQLQNFSNLVFTALLDPTDITTEGGRRFLLDRGGLAGTEIADNYEVILADLGVAKGGTNGYPFVGRDGNTDVTTGLEAGAKVQASFIGMRANDTKLKDLNSYMMGLRAPAGVKDDTAAIARGRLVFRKQCTTCHNDDQSKFVPQNIVAFNNTVELYKNAPTRPDLWPAYAGSLVAARGTSGLAPVRNDPGIFDDKLVIVEASNRDQPRGDALPLLMDLARKPNFLHDSSVPTLDALLDPARGEAVPHPFYVSNAKQRADVVTFLNSLDDQPL